MKRTVEGVEFDLEGLSIYPGHINAHDHLDFALFPRLGNGPYPNATAWARDIYHPDQSPIFEHLQVPKHLRLLWGGLRNLLAGVTTVSHHNPYEPLFDEDFPVRVVKNYGWAHSLAFDDNLQARFMATPADAPFLIHAAEGTDATSTEEVFVLDRLGVLNARTVLVHAVALNDKGWQLVRDRKASVITCPRSNIFTLGRTASVPTDIPVGLGTDSPLTTEGDFLDELRGTTDLRHDAALILRLPQTEDYIAAPGLAQQPELVVIHNRLHLVSPRLATMLPAELRTEFSSLHIEAREPVLVRWNIPQLIAQTGLQTIRLAGRLLMP